MREWLARRALDRFAADYRYDVSYMRAMLKASPAAFFKFAPIMRLAAHRARAPIDALYAAKLVGALREDCGPCVQLVATMARRAGVSAADVEAIVRSDAAAMTADAALGFRFAAALVGRTEELAAAREAVKERWGEAGVIDLTLGAQVSRIFPMVKAGLGHAQSCERIRIGDKMVCPNKVAA